MTGYLCNGCIDRDIQHRALMALEANRKVVVRYGEGSRYIVLKIPGGGALNVLLDPAPDRDMLLTAKRDFDERRPARLSFRASGADHSHRASPMSHGCGFTLQAAARSFELLGSSQTPQDTRFF